VDAERAETHLRLMAETEFRRAATSYGEAVPFRGEGRTPLVPPHLRLSTARLRNVAQALTTVGAIGQPVAEAILANFELALAVRQPAHGRPPIAGGSVAMRRRVARIMQGSQQALSAAFGVSPAAPGAPGAPGTPAAPAPAAQRAPERVVPVGMMVPVRDEEVRGELYLMAFAQTANGAGFSVHGWLREALSDMPPHGPIRLLRDFTATDDRGGRYWLRFAGLGTMAGWNGLLRLDPAPPAGIRWLDLVSPGGPTRRVSLDSPRSPVITVTGSTRSPGEHLLHTIAARILTGAAEVTAHRGSTMGVALREASQLSTGLGDIVEALVAAKALSPLSPVPGQVAMLCESLDLRDHGITAFPAPELPAPWLSMLSYVHRRKPEIASPRDGCADVAVRLAELDGITVSILGLHANEESTDLHVHLTGLPLDANLETCLLPTLWLRDDTGRWHATRAKVVPTAHEGEAAVQFQILPALTRCASIDIVAAGQSAEVRTTLPVRWR
jgi:hypothetical protein